MRVFFMLESRTGGITASASVIGRRGYDAPLFMTEVLAANSSTPVGAPFGLHTQWDPELRLQRTMLIRGKLHVDFVGEAINLVNINRTIAGEAPLLTSRTLRVGVVISR